MSKRSVWKPVKGYEGFYEVSKYGVVRSIDRKVKSKHGRIRLFKAKVLKPKLKPDGYYFVTLSKNGVPKTHYIHRLVAIAFISNPNKKGEVNHISGDKSDNTLENLEWVTHKENVQHAFQTGLNNQKGGKHTFAVSVTDNELGRKFKTIKEWCIARNINYSTGRNMLNRSNKKKVISLKQITYNASYGFKSKSSRD